MTDPHELILVISTVESAEDADQLASSLVQRGLAACVQIDGPITSHFRWRGELQRSSEFRLMIKTTENQWHRVKRHLEQNHPYDQPEIIMLPVADSNEDYRDWVIAETGNAN